MGNLDETFFDMIPKSLAFKPLDNVKKFITQFILPEKHIEVDVLRENIRNLREMQLLIDEIRKQISDLKKIIETNDKMEEIQRDILVINILLKIADIEDKKSKIADYQNKLELKNQELSSKKSDFKKISEDLNSEQEILYAIRVDISNNECSKLIEKLNQDLKMLEIKKSEVSSHIEILHSQLDKVIRSLKFVPDVPENFNSLDIRNLEKSTISQNVREELFVTLNSIFKKANLKLNEEKAENNQYLNILANELSEIKEKIDRLRKNKITYPTNTIRLIEAVKTEFENRSIDSEVRVFADLLEITNPEW